MPDPQGKNPEQIEAVYGPEGSYVSIAERAELLTEAITKIGLSNQRLGLKDASHMRPHSRKIWGEYTSETQTVLNGAERNQAQYLNEAKRAFYKATGLAAMKNSGMIRKNTHDAIGRTFWRGFETELGGVGRAKVNARNRFRTKMKKHITRHQQLSLGSGLD